MYEYRAQCVRVIDGDTVELLIDCGLDIHFRLKRARLEGINAPELGTPEGAAAFTALRAHIEGKPVMVQTVKLSRTDAEKIDKWGRYLVRIMLDGDNVNAWLVKAGFAVEYGGAAVS